jgi:deleted in liver cancer protein
MRLINDLLSFTHRYCPSHRTGWNWELPKFIKKIKTPDYKGETCLFSFMLIPLSNNV